MRLLIAAISFVVTIGGLLIGQSFSRPAKRAGEAARLAQPWLGQGLAVPTATLAPTAFPATANGQPLAADTLSPTAVPIPTPTATATPVAIPLVVSMGTPTPSPTHTPSPTPTPTKTPSPTPAPTITAAPTPESTPVPTATATPIPTPTPTPEPTATATPANYTIGLVTLTSPVERGRTAELKIQTTAGAQCNLTVTLPSGSVSGAKDKNTGIKLIDAVAADASGYIDWQWTVGGSTKPGTAQLAVGCGYVGQNYSSALQMEITE